MSSKKKYSYFIGGVLICFLGAVCFSTKAVIVKLAYRDTAVDAVTLLALRMVFALPFFIVTAVASSKRADNVKFTTKQWIGIAFTGCLGYYVSSLLDFLGLQYITAGIERLVLFIYPTLVLLISALIFKSKVTRLQWHAVALTYIGLSLAFYGEVNFEGQQENFYWGTFLIFICAITYALYIVGSGRIIPQVGAAKFNSYAMSFACLGVLTHYVVTNHQSLFEVPSSVYGYSLLMAILSTVIPSYLVAEGIKRIGSDNAAIVGSVGPVSTIIQAYFFLQEPILVLQIIGTVLILIGVLLIGKKKPQVSTTSLPA
jgi:drug/metabolite transporter (DMT)-like permease